MAISYGYIIKWYELTFKEAISYPKVTLVKIMLFYMNSVNINMNKRCLNLVVQNLSNHF